MKVGDRVKVVFACPMAPKCHEDYLGMTGYIEKINHNFTQTITNVWGQVVLNPHGPYTIRFDERRTVGNCTFSVGHGLFSWELEKSCEKPLQNG